MPSTRDILQHRSPLKRPHLSLSFCHSSPSEASAAAWPAGLASLAERQARDQPTATMLSDSPGVIKSSPFTPDRPSLSQVELIAQRAQEERREKWSGSHWPCLGRGCSLSTHADRHLGIYQGFSVTLSTTMYLAIIPWKRIHTLLPTDLISSGEPHVPPLLPPPPCALWCSKR